MGATQPAPSLSSLGGLPLAGGTMTGPLIMPAGSVGAPAIAFVDPDEGWYRAADGDVRLALEGADVLGVDTAGLDITGDLVASGTPIPQLSSANPVAETNPATAAPGAVGTSSDSGHRHAIAAPATPSTQAFGDAATSGAGTGFATDTHKHGFPNTWGLVASGDLGAVSSLDLASLSGFKTYHLVLFFRGTNAALNAVLLLNNISSSNYHNHAVKNNNGVNSSFDQVTSASAQIMLASGGNPAAGMLDLYVMHDDQASSNMGFLYSGWSIGITTGTSGGYSGAGQLNSGVASITEINLAFGAAIVGGHYALYGMN